MGRSSAVLVWVGCESGHSFCWQLASHKRQLLATVEDAVEVSAAEPSRGEPVGGELWRA
jgi:hypothetical protein